MNIFKAIASFIGINRSWLTLLALGGVAAFLWVEYATVRNERDRFRAWADVVCASAGTTFAPAAKSKLKPGAQCRAEIAALAKFRADQARLTAQTLADAAVKRDGKINRDIASAAKSARTAAQAAAAMEKQDAKVTADQVDADWFDALNGLAGLRRKAN